MIYKFYLFLAISSSFFFFFMFGPHSFFAIFFSILPFKIKLVWELGFLFELKSKISLVIILQDYPRLENSPEFGLVFYIIKLGLSLYILNPIDSITRVSNFFYLFENPSVALTFYFLHTEKFVPTQCDAPTTNIGLLKSVFLVIFFKKISAFNIWFIMIRLSNLFCYGFHDFITISYPHYKF
jgi:hypothetical protein